MSLQQGLNKRSAASLYGERVVEQWRREYRGCPPPASPADVSALAAAPQYEGVPIPSAESLRDVVERVAVVWLDAILPVLRQSRHVLVVSHSNTLRALCMIIEGLSEEAIVSLNIPTCVPLSFSLDVTGPRVSVLQKEYLGEDATVRARIEEVAMQSKL